MPIIGCLDYPAANATLAVAQFYLGGWVFKTADGSQPGALFIGYVEVGGQGRRIQCQQMQVFGHVDRPDVYGLYLPYYPAVKPDSGCNIALAPPPPGTWLIEMAWADPATGEQWNTERQVTLTD